MIKLEKQNTIKNSLDQYLKICDKLHELEQCKHKLYVIESPMDMTILSDKDRKFVEIDKEIVKNILLEKRKIYYDSFRKLTELIDL